jgi:hypothetical protein
MTTEHILDKFEGIDIDKMAKLGAEHFTKPDGMSKEDFIQKIKNEILNKGIEIKIRETIFTRKLA